MQKYFPSKSNKDLIILILVTFLISIILINIDAFELFAKFSEEHEEYELDEIVLILLVLSFSTIWFSIRRYFENKNIHKLLESVNTK